MNICATKVAFNSSSVNWEQVKEWDERYVFHVLATKDEFNSTPVESADGCYVTLAGGTKIFDFANQLVCVNMGHRHPRIQAAICEATEKSGYIWERLDHRVPNSYRRVFAIRRCRSLITSELVTSAASSPSSVST